jgi:type II secretory pathway component PulF
MSPEVVAALSEGQRAIAHVVVLLVLAVAIGLAYLMRRRATRHDQTRETQRIPEEKR